MAFKPTKDDLKKSQKCPPGMHLGELVEVEEEYVSDKGATVQKCWFETNKGYQIPVWFNDKVMSNLFEFVEAADKIKLDMDTIEDMPPIDLKNYLHKPVAFSVSHNKSEKDGKIYTQIDNFFSADKVPF
jgi:hypothetical protein